MTTDPEPTPTSATGETGDVPENPVPDVPDPVEETTPEPPEQPAQPIQFEPFTWYEVTSVCTTAGCANLNTTTTEPMVYSNAGTVILVCGLCNRSRPVLAATKLDPQPEMT